MGKSQTQTATNTQSSQTTPWDAAQPLLTNLINSYGQQGTSVTPAQSSAIGNITTEANGVQGFNTNAPISNLLSSSTSPQQGMLASGLSNLNNSVSPITNPANLNPMNTPGLSDALGTMTQDVTNAVKGVYAGSGRDPSGAGSFAQSLARGITQGEAPTIAGAYQSNVNNLLNGAGMLNGQNIATQGAITGQQQVPLSNQAQAIGLIPGAATAATAPGTAQMNAANLSYMAPYTNLSALLQPSIALGSMGSQSTGSSTATQTQPESTMGNIMGGISGGVGLLGQMGAFGPAGWLLASDERVKEDIKPVGKLNDGQKVYRYRYKGEPTFQIGLLAQEVAKRKPGSVGEFAPGMLGVNYKTATDHAAHLEAA